jgi:hypothetical protein
MVIGVPIKIATAAMEDIYERLCWLHTTVNSTIVYDAIGNSYPLSDLTKLSEAQILYPAQFVNKFDCEQNSVLWNLQMKDVLCASTNGIDQGRDPSTWLIT